MVERCYAVSFMLSVTYAKCHIKDLYAECCYAECCNAECRIKYLYAECCYAECRRKIVPT